tara:strand:- start:250 stop:441 length:192 start_codon:yes stop_codon:yes gene_type:complete
MSRLNKIERKYFRGPAEYSNSLNDLWVMVSDAHEHLDEGNVDTKQAIAHARQACLAFLFETEA